MRASLRFSMESITSITNIENVKKELFSNVMKGDWEKVIRRYKEDGRAHTLKIARSGHTALHLAVSNGEGDIVEQMVETIQMKSSDLKAEVSEALAIGTTEGGQTALHFAAMMGNFRMCKCIASVSPTSLIGRCNMKGETPLFLAVLCGQKQAFLCLNAMCLPEQGYSFSRREDGQTILHCAILEEDFELALQIIRLYNGLVNLVDNEGNSPLHILASKPSCFRSGTNLG